MKKQFWMSPLVAAVVAMSAPAHAKVGADEAAKLGKDLTPVGAERAGNKAGTIPAWTPQSQIAYKKGEYPNDPALEAEKPLFTIAAADVGKYAAQLTEGHKELFKRYPNSYKMIVYPSHRNFNFPDKYMEETMKNGRKAVKGKCPTCGAVMFKILGGKATVAAPPAAPAGPRPDAGPTPVDASSLRALVERIDKLLSVCTGDVWEKAALPADADRVSASCGGLGTEADAAIQTELGRIVEGLSHSSFWPSMAIMVVEDDAQNGVDHVDGHRTVALVASPYKSAYVAAKHADLARSWLDQPD